LNDLVVTSPEALPLSYRILVEAETTRFMNPGAKVMLGTGGQAGIARAQPWFLRETGKLPTYPSTYPPIPP